LTSRSKRRFLKAAAAAVTVMSLPARSRSAAPGESWDLIVVGGGTAGLPTALFAAQRGARVLIVEASGVLGGTLPSTLGMISAAGSQLQRSKGIEDTPQAHFEDIMRISGGTADPVIMRLAVTQAAPTFDWLMDHGFEVAPGLPVTGTVHQPYSRPRYAWSPEGGAAILRVLNEQLKPEMERGRVVVLLNTQAIDLIRGRDAAILGVVTKSETGMAKHLGRYTVLTSGGYTYDSARYVKLERARNYSRATYPYGLGQGLDLAVTAGGYVRGGEFHNPLFGGVLANSDYPSPVRALVRHFPAERPPFEIFVNAAGRRFLREDVPSHTEYEAALRELPEERCWVVFDQAIFEAAPPIATDGLLGPWSPADTKRAFENSEPMFFRANTLAELARLAAIDGEGLAETVSDYNRGQASGRDAFGRRHMPLPIEKPPFYAIQLQSWNLLSYAGIAVDDHLRVIRRDGTPIPNLYAAGELLGLGTLNGRAACGGMGITPALAFGRLLGRELLTFDS
jgi:fumarate reductase flavoprotein subunit